MTATFGADLVDKTKQAKVDACRARIQSAARAAKQLETDVRWLVKERAWEVLGYKDFSEMWQQENGFPAPTQAQVLVIDAFRVEGMSTSRGRNKPNGHTLGDVADSVGIPRSSTHGVLTQLRHGVPAENVMKGNSFAQFGDRIANFGRTPASPAHQRRAQPKRMGKAPNELVTAGFNITRADADAIADIARDAHVPAADIYRQAVAEYLMRHRESRPGQRGADVEATNT
jgi:hypothetical protein